MPPDPDGLPDGAGGDPARFEADLADYRARFGPGLRLAATHRYRGDDAKRLARLADLAGRQGLALVATNDVHHHAPDRRPLADVMTCIREKTTIHAAGWRLAANAERHLKAPGEIARLFRRWPDAVAEAGRIAEACRFLAGPSSPTSTPTSLVEGDAHAPGDAGAADRRGRRLPLSDGVPDKVTRQIDHELALIGQLGYAALFPDRARRGPVLARAQGILCQGPRLGGEFGRLLRARDHRGRPGAHRPPVRALSSVPSRGEPPDIDVDSPSTERREEGDPVHSMASTAATAPPGLTATVICYRARGAIREVGKAMGLSEDTVDKLARTLWGWSREGDRRGAHPPGPASTPPTARLRQAIGAGAPADRASPRHLSQHVGGFVISRGPLSELVPIETRRWPTAR